MSHSQIKTSNIYRKMRCNNVVKVDKYDF